MNVSQHTNTSKQKDNMIFQNEIYYYLLQENIYVL